MIRVIHYAWSMDFGGIERLILDLSIQQQKNPELKCTVVTGRGGGSMLGKLTASGINAVVLDLKNGATISRKKFLRMKSIFSGADILHLHTFTPLVAAAARASGARIVFTEHGNFGFGRKTTPSDRINRILLRYFLNHHVDFVSFNSEFTMAEARRRYGLGKIKQAVIYNGTLLNVANKQTGIFPGRENLEGKFVVGTSSRLAGFKRIDRLINAFALFARDKNDAILFIVGEGPLKDELQKLTVEKGIAGNSIFAGYSSEVTSAQSMMQVCVFPSQGEPFGIAALETLALGKPTLVMADGGGILEIINGISPDDVTRDETQLATRLEYYYSRRGSVDENVQRRKEYVQRFDISKMQEQFMAVYKNLLS